MIVESVASTVRGGPDAEVDVYALVVVRDEVARPLARRLDADVLRGGAPATVGRSQVLTLQRGTRVAPRWEIELTVRDAPTAWLAWSGGLAVWLAGAWWPAVPGDPSVGQVAGAGVFEAYYEYDLASGALRRLEPADGPGRPTAHDKAVLVALLRAHFPTRAPARANPAPPGRPTIAARLVAAGVRLPLALATAIARAEAEYPGAMELRQPWRGGGWTLSVPLGTHDPALWAVRRALAPEHLDVERSDTRENFVFFPESRSPERGRP